VHFLRCGFSRSPSDSIAHLLTTFSFPALLERGHDVDDLRLRFAFSGNASSLEMAGTSLTGMLTLPDESDGGAMTPTRSTHNGPILSRSWNKIGSFGFSVGRG